MENYTRKRKRSTYTFDEDVIKKFKKYCEDNKIFNKSKMIEWLIIQFMDGKLWNK